MRGSIGRQGFFTSTRFIVVAALFVSVLVMARFSLPAVDAGEPAPDIHVQTMCIACHQAK